MNDTSNPLIQKLPRLNHVDYQSIKDKFLARVTPDMTAEDKNTLNEEYNKACEKARQDIAKKTKEVAKLNVAAFLSNPAKVLEELEHERLQGIDIGEMILMKGIADVTIKRHGKGTPCGVGSDYPYISSNFTVTATIGDKKLTTETTSANDQRSKDSIMAMVAQQLAFDIAAGRI